MRPACWAWASCKGLDRKCARVVNSSARALSRAFMMAMAGAVGQFCKPPWAVSTPSRLEAARLLTVTQSSVLSFPQSRSVVSSLSSVSSVYVSSVLSLSSASPEVSSGLGPPQFSAPQFSSTSSVSPQFSSSILLNLLSVSSVVSSLLHCLLSLLTRPLTSHRLLTCSHTRSSSQPFVTAYLTRMHSSTARSRASLLHTHHNTQASRGGGLSGSQPG